MKQCDNRHVLSRFNKQTHVDELGGKPYSSRVSRKRLMLITAKVLRATLRQTLRLDK